MAQRNSKKLSVVKLKPDLHRALRIRAAEKSVTITALVDSIIERFFAADARKLQKKQQETVAA